MGVTLNWSSNYPLAIDDQVTNYPIVADTVHDVLASHVNELAKAVVALENVAGGLRVTPIAEPLSPTHGDVFQYNNISGEWEAVAVAAIGTTLQIAYNGGNTISLAAATPVAITTSGVGQDGITVTDGTDTVTVRGSEVETLEVLGASTTLPLVLNGNITTGVSGAIQLNNVNQFTASSGSQVFTAITGDVNQSGTAGYVALAINITETGVGSGEHQAILALLGGATLFKVSDVGLDMRVSGTLANPAIELNNASVGLYNPSGNILGFTGASSSFLWDPDAATTTLRPDTTETYYLGDTTYRWLSAYFAGVVDIANSGTSDIVQVSTFGITYDGVDNDFAISATGTAPAAAAGRDVQILGQTGGAASGAAGGAGTDILIRSGLGGAGDGSFTSGRGGNIDITARNAGADGGAGGADGGDITLTPGSATGAGADGQVFLGSDGSASAPALAFVSNANTGLLNIGGNASIASDGTEMMRFIEAGGNSQVLTVTGSAVRPAYAFLNDVDLGMYRAGTNTLAFRSSGNLWTNYPAAPNGSGLYTFWDVALSAASQATNGDGWTGLQIDVTDQSSPPGSPGAKYLLSLQVDSVPIVSVTDTSLQIRETSVGNVGGTLSAPATQQLMVECNGEVFTLSGGDGGTLATMQFADGLGFGGSAGVFIRSGTLSPATDAQGNDLHIEGAYSGTSAAASTGKTGGSIEIICGDGGDAADASSTAGDGGVLTLDAGNAGATGAGAPGTAGNVLVGTGQANAVRIGRASGDLGFHGATPVSQQTVSGARDNPEAALANLLTALDALGLINDTTTAS